MAAAAMAARAGLVVTSALLALLGSTARADLPDTQPCPAACECHYSRIFWETDCTRRDLETTPDGLSPDVYSLDLTGNKLEKLGPFAPGCRLRRLAARENRLRSVVAADLAGLDSLVEVDLSQNQLTALDPTTFRNASGLLTLTLANNQLEAPAGPIVSSDSLKNLDLHGNRLGALPSNVFANCTSVATLDLSDNPLGALPAAAMAPLTGLEMLSVARCGLEALDPAALAPLSQLKSLDASGNRLGAASRWAPALRPLARLDALTLAQAALEGPLPDDAFARCASLRRLALSDNPLLRDPWPAAAALSALNEIEVRGSGLTALAPAELRANLSALRLLEASENALGPALPAGALALPALETLRLARCGLRVPPAHDAFRESGVDGEDEPTLGELSLAGNPLRLATDAPLLPAASQGSLRKLDLSNCSLSDLPAATLRGAVNLTELQLHDNPIEQMPESALRELPALTTLDLRDCALRAAYPHQLSHAPRLRALRLAGNPWRCGCALRGLWEWAAEGKGDIGVLESAHNLTCVPLDAATAAPGTPSTAIASAPKRWEVAVEEASDCPVEALAVSKAVRRRAAPPAVAAVLVPVTPTRRLGPALLVPAAAALVGSVVIAAVSLVGAARWRSRRRLSGKLPRLAAP